MKFNIILYPSFNCTHSSKETFENLVQFLINISTHSRDSIVKILNSTKQCSIDIDISPVLYNETILNVFIAGLNDVAENIIGNDSLQFTPYKMLPGRYYAFLNSQAVYLDVFEYGGILLYKKVGSKDVLYKVDMNDAHSWIYVLE